MKTEALAVIATVVGFVLFIKRAQSPEPIGAWSDPLWSSASYPRSIVQFAQAIAHAEGFNVSGSAPDRAHNPGAIKVPGWSGPVTGTQGISVFASDDEGWQALYRQLNLIATQRSGVYTLNMTIEDMARRWTSTAQSAWAGHVASALGVSPSTRLSQVLA
jgi:hypothetical protein